MPPPSTIPPQLTIGPFTASDAARFGVSEKVLRGSRFRRLHPRVWVLRDYEMTHRDWITAAALSMPARAQLSHASRIQALGLDIGGRSPIQFTVAGDLHIATEGIFLHRTEVLPPLDDVGVTPAAAFIQFCDTAPLIDTIVAGDWLLHHRYMTAAEVAELAHHHDWRPGAKQARRVLGHLTSRSRSPKESETRAIVLFSGLPIPEVNVPLHHDGQQIAIVDLLLAYWRLVLEYEGRQHALDTNQFQTDIFRYSRLRTAGYEYIQVTQSMLDQPRALAIHVHQALVRRGYGGPPPQFGARWHSLFEPISVRPRLRAVS